MALRQRVEPRACHGAEWLIIRRDWKARLDRLQDSWAMWLLGLEVRQPRVRLMREMGHNTRLSTRTMVRAIALKARIDMLPPAHICAKVASVAAGCLSTWTAVVIEQCRAWDIPPIMEWLGQHSCEHMSKSACKRKVKEYIDRVVWPAAMH